MGKKPDKSKKYYHPRDNHREEMRYPCGCIITRANATNCARCGAMVCKLHGCQVC